MKEKCCVQPPFRKAGVEKLTIIVRAQRDARIGTESASARGAHAALPSVHDSRGLPVVSGRHASPANQRADAATFAKAWLNIRAKGAALGLGSIVQTDTGDRRVRVARCVVRLAADVARARARHPGRVRREYESICLPRPMNIAHVRIAAAARRPTATRTSCAFASFFARADSTADSEERRACVRTVSVLLVLNISIQFTHVNEENNKL